MSEPMTPPIDPALEQLVTAALHDHARSVVAPPDAAALRARLVQQDRVMGLRRIGLISGLVVVILAGLVALGASRRDSELRTAAGPVTAVAAGRHGSRPGGTDVAAPDGGTSDEQAGPGPETSDLSIPLPGDVGPDGSPSTSTTSPTPGGLTTTTTPGVTARPPDGTPTTTPSGPGTPGGPGGPSPTTASTAAPTTGPITGPPPTAPPPTAPPTTIDPGTQCSAHQVNTEMRLSVGAAAPSLLAMFDNGLAPPNSAVTVSSDDPTTQGLILSTATRADALGHWTWNIQWDPRRTPPNTPLSFFIQCANGKKLPFTVTRVR